MNPASGRERQVASDLAHNPEAKGRGLAEKDQQEKGQATGPPATSGEECSGQKKPDYSEVVLVRPWAVGVLGIWTGVGWVTGGTREVSLQAA